MTNNQQSNGVERAVKLAGGQVALARLLGVTQQAISIWLRRGYVPLRRAQEIEAQLGVPRNALIAPHIQDLASPVASL